GLHNDFAGFAGQNTSFCFSTCSAGVAIGADLTNIGSSRSPAANAQDGDNRLTSSQSASGTTGDGVAGEVIGAVTSAGGSTSIVGANTSTDSSVETGDVS